MSLNLFLDFIKKSDKEKEFILYVQKEFSSGEISDYFSSGLELLNQQHNTKDYLFLARCNLQYKMQIFGKDSIENREAEYELCRAWVNSRDNKMMIEAEATLKKMLLNKDAGFIYKLYAELGLLYFKKHQFDKAKTYLVYALNNVSFDQQNKIEIFENYAPILNNLIIVQIALREFETAEKKLHQLKKIVLDAGEQGKGRLAFVYFQYGSLYNNWLVDSDSEDPELFQKSKRYFKDVIEKSKNNIILQGTAYKGLADLHNTKHYIKKNTYYPKAISLIEQTPFRLENNNFYLLNFYKFWLIQLNRGSEYSKILAIVNDIENKLKSSDNKDIIDGNFTIKSIPLFLADIYYFKIIAQFNLNIEYECDLNYTIRLCEHLFANNPINELSEIFNIYRNVLLLKWELATVQKKVNIEETYTLLIWSKSLYTRHLSNLNKNFKEQLLKERYTVGQLTNDLLDSINKQDEKKVFDIEGEIAKAKLSIIDITEKTENYALVNYKSIKSKIQSRLNRKEVLFDFYSSDNFLFLVIVSQDIFETLKIKLPKKRLNVLIDEFIESICNYLIDKSEFEEIQQILSKEILDPILNLIPLSKFTKLNIVIDEKIGQLPLGLLLFNDKVLDIQIEINYFFSTYAFIEKTKKAENSIKNIGFLRPQYANSANLKEAKTEIHNIRRTLTDHKQDTEILSYEYKDQLLNTVIQKDVLHISAHLEANFYTGKLEPAIPLKSFASISNDYLFLNDIFYNNFENLQMVFLNCCNTTSGKNIVGEGLQSFSTIFIKSGARNVIHTVVKVNDKNARIFAEKFYAYYLKTGTPSKALWETKKDLYSLGYQPHMFGIYQIMIA